VVDHARKSSVEEVMTARGSKSPGYERRLRFTRRTYIPDTNSTFNEPHPSAWPPLPDHSLTGPNTVPVLLAGNVDWEMGLVAIIGIPE
jgi:hypothetical protein